MKRIARLLFAFILVVGIGGPKLAVADDLDAIRSLVQKQLDAFQADDGGGAYSLAAPGIQTLFPSPEIFMDMVRQRYQPVYRPKSVTFGTLTEGPNGPMQKVFLVGPDGKNYVAVYTLERQEDGSWKISGCYIVVDDSPTI